MEIHNVKKKVQLPSRSCATAGEYPTLKKMIFFFFFFVINENAMFELTTYLPTELAEVVVLVDDVDDVVAEVFVDAAAARLPRPTNAGLTFFFALKKNIKMNSSQYQVKTIIIIFYRR